MGVDGESDRLTPAMRSLAEASVPIDDISLRRPTLDEVFLALTGRTPDDEADAA
jgi:ABC-2 type transport system ATP-binding protein